MNSPRIVLHVDGDVPARLVRTQILQRAGFGVRETDSAADVLERAPEASLVLLDAGLPDCDGFAVCEQVKKLLPALPVVMVSSLYRTAQARRDAFAMGADAFLLEPVDPEQLVRTIETLVARGAAPVAAEEQAWIITDRTGDISEISLKAATLLNLSARGARGRSLPPFFVENRPMLMHEMMSAAEGLIVERSTLLQPRDRRPVRVRIDVSALPQTPGDGVRLLWAIARDSR